MNEKDKMMIGLGLYASDYYGAFHRSIVRPMHKRLTRIKEGVILMRIAMSAPTYSACARDTIQGFKHIFGVSANQKRTNAYMAAIAHVSEYRQGIYRPLMENQYDYIRQHAPYMTPPSLYKQLDPGLVVNVLDNMASLDLVCIQPMVELVGKTYYMTVAEAPAEMTSTSPEGGKRLCIEIISMTTEVKSRKLNAPIAIDQLDNLARAVGICQASVASEMKKGLSASIGADLDSEVIADLHHLATPLEDATLPTDSESVRATVAATLLNRAANHVAVSTRRGSANWAIVGSDLATLLATSSAFVPINGTTPNRVHLIGVLNGNMKIYVDCLAAKNSTSVLVGYKGYGYLDAGYFYNPYLIAMSTGVVINPATFEPQISLITRYGKTVVPNAAKYYAKFNINMEVPNVAND